jgi:hypothetical protein
MEKMRRGRNGFRAFKGSALLYARKLKKPLASKDGWA